MTLPRIFTNIILMLSAAIILAACDTTVDTPYTGATFPLLAPVAPPPNMYEEKPENTYPKSYTWRDGYWSYTGSSFVWISGDYIPRPSPTAVWAADHWVHHTYGWGFVPGHWQ